MKKSMKLYLSGLVLIAGLLPLTLLAQPKVGDVCSGDVNFPDAKTCSIPIEGEDKSKVYTYSITVMNIGNKAGYFSSKQISYFPGKYYGRLIEPGKTNTIITDSHFCMRSGGVKPADLIIAGTQKYYYTDYVQMQITDVSVIKSTPKSDLSCHKLENEYVLR
jgi:hypothetical protein